MTPQDLLNIIGQFTKADWIAFDAARKAAFTLTQVELDAQKTAIHNNQIAYLKTKLALYGISFTEPTTRSDWKIKFNEYIKGTPDCKEWLGENLDQVVQDKLTLAELNGNDYFGEFYKLVSQLEC